MPPASIIKPSLISGVKSIAHLPSNNWYLLAATALSTLNRPNDITHVFKNAIENRSKDQQLSIARRTREALVKSSAIIGLPKTINALFSLKSVTPKELIDEPLGYSPSSRAIDIYTTPPSTILQRGQSFFDKVYGKVTNRVMGQMDRSGSEDLGLLARLEYGYVLSPSNVLSPAETSFGKSCFPTLCRRSTKQAAMSSMRGREPESPGSVEELQDSKK